MVIGEPLRETRWATARWLVLAPHPDDETLGAGALIADSAARGLLGAIIYLTDGTGSHPDGADRLAAVRRAEALEALRRLGAGRTPVRWIGWRDAHPPDVASRVFTHGAGRLAAILRTFRIDAVAVSDRTEVHCDHRAAYDLAEAAVARARRGITLFSYHVWSTPAAGTRRIVTPAMPAGRRLRALRAHRSQLSSRLGEGFRLPREKLRMPVQDALTLRSDPR